MAKSEKVKVKAIYDLSVISTPVFLWGFEFTKSEDGFYAELEKADAESLIEAGRAEAV
jgi:hypothetical protein